MTTRRLTPALALLGLFSALTLAGGRPVFGGHRGQTYHYNGQTGYWTCPVYPNCNPGYATQPASYAQQPVYQPAQYSVPQPTYPTPVNAVYAPGQSPWMRR